MEQPIKADDFLSDAPPERIIGSECEYTIQSKIPNQILDANKYIPLLAIRKSGLRCAGEYLSNGARLYEDSKHIEYATAECVGPEQAAAADLAGLEVVSNIVVASKKPYGGLFRTAGVFLNQSGTKEVVVKNHEGTTSGYHQNFLYPTQIMHTKLFHHAVTAHLMSRVWSMNGAVRPNGYWMSQKIYDIGGAPLNRSDGRRTTSKAKPMYMQPRNDHDIQPSPAWNRLEVRYADPVHSPLALYLGFATTSLVLRIPEHARLFSQHDYLDLRMSAPVRSARQFARDISFQYTTENAKGKRLTAINIGEILLEKVRHIADRVNLPDDEVRAIALWQDVLDRMHRSDFEKGDYAGLEYMLDSAARHKLLLKYFPDQNSWGTNDEVKRISMGYDLIAPKQPASRRWQNIPREVVPESMIEEFKTSPPNTRAARRAWVIRNRRKLIRRINWSYIYYKDDSPTELLKNPYATSKQ